MFITKGFKILSGSSNPEFAESICGYLRDKRGMEVELGKVEVGKFNNGECEIAIVSNIRLKDVFIVQSVCPSLGNSVNDNLVELCLMIDAAVRASAVRITAVIPHFGYARQDRKTKPRVPISARLIADFLEISGIDRVITLDLHANQIQGFFKKPVDNLWAQPILLGSIKKIIGSGDELFVISPDAGGMERARSYAKKLHCLVGMVDKRRPRPGESKVMHIVGKVKGKKVLIIDDMIDTGGTLINAAEKCLEEGAKEVHAAGTHPVFSNDAVKRIEKSPIKTLIVTDSLPIKEEAERSKKIIKVSTAGLFGEAILRSHVGDSVNSLF